MTKEDAIAKAPVGRVRRSPLTNKGKLSVSRKDPAFEYRYVNDEGDNVSDKIERGWEPVLKSETAIGDRRVDQPAAEGSYAQVTVGQGRKAVLMKIKKEWYEEDQAIKQGDIDSKERQMLSTAAQDGYGRIDIFRK